MDFIDLLKQFSSRVAKIKDQISTEEATKMSLIVPFFQMLGYDVFNPDEFMPEYTADLLKNIPYHHIISIAILERAYIWRDNSEKAHTKYS